MKILWCGALLALPLFLGMTSAASGLRCAPADRDSSLVNGGFEVWSDSLPEGWKRVVGADEGGEGGNSAIERIEDAGEGRFAVRLSGVAGTRRWYALSQTLPAVPGEIWSLSGWMRTGGVQRGNHTFNNCGLVATFYDSTGSSIGRRGTRAADGTSRWTRREILFKVPGHAATLDAGIFLSMTGTADFDGLALGRYRVPGSVGTREERWRGDLQFFADYFPHAHADPFTRTTGERFRASIGRLKEAVAGLEDAGITVELMKIVATIGDSHTGIFPNEFHMYPVYCNVFADGLFITAATEEHAGLLRSRLVGIGDFGIGEVCERLKEVIPHENESVLRSGFPQVLMLAEVLQILGILPARDGGRFVVEDREGARRSVDLSVIPAGSRPEWVKAVPFEEMRILPGGRVRHKAYSFEYLDGTGTLFIQYNACREMPGEPFRTFAEAVLAAVDSMDIDKLVIDLRYNRGGDSSVMAPLIEALAERRERKCFGVAYVLIGRETYSSAVLNAIEIRRALRATLVGEPTGGKPNHFGEIDSFTLPHSGITVFHPTKYFRPLAAGDPSTLEPDIVVEIESEDYFSITDPVMDAVTALE